MPAYFSMVTTVRKEDNYEDFFARYIECLIDNGYAFKGGYYEAANKSLEELIEINVTKLRENFELGYDASIHNDYKQIVFEYPNLSEVRIFIINDGQGDYYTISLIIPEDEIIEWNGGEPDYDDAFMNGLKKVALDIWSYRNIDNIQTSLELSDGAALPEEMEAGASASIEPFAIVEKEHYHSADSDKYISLEIERGGILIENASISL